MISVIIFLTGLYATLGPELKSRVNVIAGDLSTLPIEKSYDMAWLTNIYHYMAEPLWWCLLIRAIHSLPLPGVENPRGGVLVTNRSDLDIHIIGTPSQGILPEFLELAGMSLVGDSISSPLELRRDMVIATRTHESAWLDRQMEHFREMGF